MIIKKSGCGTDTSNSSKTKHKDNKSLAAWQLSNSCVFITDVHINLARMSGKASIAKCLKVCWARILNVNS